MEYQKIVNLLDDKTSNKPFKFRTKNLVEKSMNQEEHIMLIVKLSLKLQC